MLPWTIRRWLGLPDPQTDRTPVRPAVVRPPNPAWDHSLAAAIRAERDALEPYAAYARWLTANNDPRGALIEGDEAMLGRHPHHFFGPLARADGVRVTWRLGFWESVVIERDWDAREVPALVAEALRHPSALVLDRLEVHADCIPDLADRLADGDVLPLRTLVVDARGGLLGAWAAVWSRMPELRQLEMTGDAPSLGDIDLPSLQKLRIDGRLDESSQWSIARMAAPALQRVELGCELGPEPAEQLARRFPNIGCSG